MNKKTSISSKIAEFKAEQENVPEYHENPLLKLLKSTKKEKQAAKTSLFNERLMSKATFNLGSGVSKSALRRRKRKEREQLKPKMDDLLLSLPETVNIVDTKKAREVKYVRDTSVPVNQPNPQKHTGHTKLLEAENKRFNQVLANREFKKSPFALLQQTISQNMGK